MCGIVGLVQTREPGVPLEQLQTMLGLIRHRGPDEFGLYRDGWAGLGNARLSIIDLSGGQQPIGNEDGSLWIVFNGEIFNYIELRPELEALGHQFQTHCDTEVVLHLYEQFGPAGLSRLNGQFAIAIWDAHNRRLFLARDRLGIRPLFYAQTAQRFLFGSEIKALLADPDLPRAIDPESLAQVFTFWSVQPPKTIFQGVRTLPPGHYAVLENGRLSVQPYWSLDFGREEPGGARSEADYLDELESLLVDATLIRLRADVPVGAYLSGGLDSSLTAALVRRHTPNRLETFSIAFSDPGFDESEHQQRMADSLRTEHHRFFCEHADIARVFPEVIWHTESPLLRTAPAPMFLLSELVHASGFKVVLTGEGADELFGGYDIFKEMAVRRFWARDPESERRPLLIKRLYPDIAALGQTAFAYRSAFFRKGLTDTGNPYYSHTLRWDNSARGLRFLHPDLGLRPTPEGEPENGYARWVPTPPEFAGWSALAQAQWLEINTFLSPYLLSSQGDRVAMAHAVEGRFPFLDYRVAEFAARLPAHLKLHGLAEKWLLRQLGRGLLPDEIRQRTKRPYRAPIQRAFFNPQPTDAIAAVIHDRALAEAGLFDPAAAGQLFRKAAGGANLSESDNMLLVGLISTQLLHDQMIRGFADRAAAQPRITHYKWVDVSSVYHG